MCSNAHNLGTKQEEAEIQVQCQTCAISGITEMMRAQLIQLECSHGQMQVFQEKQVGKIRREIAVYVKKQIGCMELFYRTDDKLVESL